MSLDAAKLRSGKGSKDENFPVASWLIRKRYRRPILAFYEFVRIADDIADHTSLSEQDKFAYLDSLEGSLLGQNSRNQAGVALGQVLQERGLSSEHALHVLRAFRQDVTKRRYRDWDDLIDYCRYSAMPVGRFLLDVHGENRTTWPAADNISAAFQVINHLQDCVLDYSRLNRVYIPLDALAAAGASVDALDAPRASPQLLACLRHLAERTGQMLTRGSDLSAMIKDWRLGMQVSGFVTLAQHFVQLLRERDSMSERVRLSKVEIAALSARGAARELLARLVRGRHPSISNQ